MSDELPAGSINLEAPPAPAAPEPPAPAEPIAVVASVTDDEIDPNAVDLKDEGRIRGLLAELSRKRGENRDLKQQTQELQQLRDWVTQKAPYVTVLEQNPDLWKRGTSAPAVAADPIPDPMAARVAQQLDFYTTDGKPDLARATEHLKLVRETAQAIVQETLQPMQRSQLEAAAAQNYQRVLALKDKDGQAINKAYVDAAWMQIQREDPQNGLHTLADPRGASFLAAAAFGLDRMTGQPTIKPPATAPIVTEAPGGRVQSPGQLSDLDRAIAAERGKSEAEWSKTVASVNYRKGRPTILED